MTPVPYQFGFRCFEIEPRGAVEWRETRTEGYPRPPREWQRKPLGFDLPWHSFNAASPGNTRIKELQDPCMNRKLNTTAITWCQESQSFWIAPLDLSDEVVYSSHSEDNWRDWSFLYFQTEDEQHLPPWQQTYRTFEYGVHRQLDYSCPAGFDEFLPENKFRGTHSNRPAQCNLIGNLSLMLALQAMCPDDVNDIPRQIAHVFWRDQQPGFTPYVSHRHWLPRNKRINPGRALVIQTSVIANIDADVDELDTREALLRDWEKGLHGPLVSSHSNGNRRESPQQIWNSDWDVTSPG